MKDFKGTPGKWYHEQGSMSIFHPEYIGSKLATVDHTYTESGYLQVKANDEWKYNAQLISKAPEMLDFINRISGEMLRNDFVLDEKWYEQARELIKDATKL